ncbi:hypothetical protein [Desulfocurvus sp. DL9XJH121]
MAEVTRVSVINKALVHLGEDRVTAENQNTLSILVDGEMDEELLALLEEHPWNFAGRTATLAESGDTDDEWRYVYTLPTDCAAPRDLVYGTEPRPYYEIRGGKLYTNERRRSLSYTRVVSDFNDMPATFRAALALRVAVVVAPKAGKKTAEVEAKYLTALRTAKTVDAQTGGHQKPVRPNHFAQARGESAWQD